MVAADWGMLVNHITRYSRCGPDGPWSAGSIFGEADSADNPAPTNRIAAGDPGG